MPAPSGTRGSEGPGLVTEGAAHQEMVQLEQPGGDRTSEKTRTQRRRAQRKLFRAVKAGIADTGDLPSGAPAASSSGSGMRGGTSTKLSLEPPPWADRAPVQMSAAPRRLDTRRQRKNTLWKRAGGIGGSD
ncbi:unnamed protein product [Prorocentrum cordatum]|uniref:Ribosome biogenesis protein NOP53 n=1 Tax=Prorocentrum cordatum TaxID=2364126 RepID=A0ABN9XKM7_9DINO|nr:unnamed protein product [Polarella glacialis]